MNKQSKDGSISWTDYTWNPIKGLCPVGCWYCYARAMHKRFKMNPEIRYIHDYDEQKQLFYCKPGTKVFVCSTFEIFHSSVKKEWRDLIFLNIENTPHVIFQILTKMPENIDRPMPDNVWLGVSITNYEDMQRKGRHLRGAKAKIKFISNEPMFGDVSLFSATGWDWIILGRLTGHGKKYDPPRGLIARVIDQYKNLNIPIFLKNNLKEIWGEKLIQEFPDAKTQGMY